MKFFDRLHFSKTTFQSIQTQTMYSNQSFNKLFVLRRLISLSCSVFLYVSSPTICLLCTLNSFTVLHCALCTLEYYDWATSLRF